jgi:hypothetical protein
MLTTTLAVGLLAIGALAHGDHADQTPVAGPHKSLWYNTLPGDGGTQVCHFAQRLFCVGLEADNCVGRLCLLWYFDFRPPAILSVSC